MERESYIAKEIDDQTRVLAKIGHKALTEIETKGKYTAQTENGAMILQELIADIFKVGIKRNGKVLTKSNLKPNTHESKKADAK